MDAPEATPRPIAVPLLDPDTREREADARVTGRLDPNIFLRVVLGKSTARVLRRRLARRRIRRF